MRTFKAMVQEAGWCVTTVIADHFWCDGGVLQFCNADGETIRAYAIGEWSRVWEVE